MNSIEPESKITDDQIDAMAEMALLTKALIGGVSVHKKRGKMHDPNCTKAYTPKEKSKSKRKAQRKARRLNRG